MGILDELKQEADRVLLQLENEEARKKRLAELYVTTAKPCLQRVVSYLSEMLEQLKIIQLKVPVAYDIPGIGVIDDLIQGNYRILLDSSENPRKLAFHYDCLSPHETRYPVTPREKSDEARSFLLSQQVRFSEWGIRDINNRLIGANYECRLKVRVIITFEPDLEAERLVVTTHNFNELKCHRMNFGLAEITDEWLDQLGHFILRKNHRLGMLNIDEGARQQIRKKIEEEKYKRQEELECAIREEMLQVDEDPKVARLFKHLRKHLF